MNSTAISGFRKLCFTTLIAVYILILLGGIVRSTGSGMGCPDWPRCYGSWVPPTTASALPENYKAINKTFREKKNRKFIGLLHAIGMESTAQQIADDKTILKEADFNLLHTWTEYMNRLAGAVIGFLVIALFWKSFQFRKSKPAFFWLAMLILIGVVVEGWFGSIVVSTNLTTWTITVHMFLALAVVWWLIYLYHLTNDQKWYAADVQVKWLLLVCMTLVLVQIYLGTQVRESVDRLVGAGVDREQWIGSLGSAFFIHRAFSWTVVLTHVVLFLKLRKTSPQNPLLTGLLVIILGAILAGVAMAYGGVPAFLQPVHLVLATISFGVQLLIFYRLKVLPKQQISVPT